MAIEINPGDVDIKLLSMDVADKITSTLERNGEELRTHKAHKENLSRRTILPKPQTLEAVMNGDVELILTPELESLGRKVCIMTAEELMPGDYIDFDGALRVVESADYSGNKILLKLTNNVFSEYDPMDSVKVFGRFRPNIKEVLQVDKGAKSILLKSDDPFTFLHRRVFEAGRLFKSNGCMTNMIKTVWQPDDDVDECIVITVQFDNQRELVKLHVGKTVR